MEEKEISTIRIALLGLGAVGSRLLSMLVHNKEELQNWYGIRIIVSKVLVRDRNKSRKVELNGIELTTDPDEIIRDSNITMVVDCMGGTGAERTRDIVLKSLKARKAVVMSSKKCLACYGKEILHAAARYQCGFRYDACVGGCIPISSILRTMARGEQIQSIYGIFNATSNYILSNMGDGLSYEEALQKARELGFAEEDPADDVEGYDTLYKLIILTGFGMGIWYSPKEFCTIPLSSVTKEMVVEAESHNSVIKAVGRITKDGDGFSYYVGPQKQEKGSLLAGVGGNHNMIFIETELSGTRAFYGQGAGAEPTASAIYDDIISLIAGEKSCLVAITMGITM